MIPIQITPSALPAPNANRPAAFPSTVSIPEALATPLLLADPVPIVPVDVVLPPNPPIPLAMAPPTPSLVFGTSVVVTDPATTTVLSAESVVCETVNVDALPSWLTIVSVTALPGERVWEPTTRGPVPETGDTVTPPTANGERDEADAVAVARERVVVLLPTTRCVAPSLPVIRATVAVVEAAVIVAVSPTLRVEPSTTIALSWPVA